MAILSLLRSNHPLRHSLPVPLDMHGLADVRGQVQHTPRQARGLKVNDGGVVRSASGSEAAIMKGAQSGMRMRAMVEHWRSQGVSEEKIQAVLGNVVQE